MLMITMEPAEGAVEIDIWEEEPAEGAVEIDICEKEPAEGAVEIDICEKEPAEGAVEIDICEAVQRKVLSSVQRKLNAVRAADNFTIFRVPAYVRQSDKDLYEPQMVAIGPYGRRDEPSLRAMEEHKWRYVDDFLSRCNTTTIVAKIQEVEPRARRCYFEGFELSTEKFVEMLLLDGCFILEFLIKWNGSNKLFPMEWSMPTVRVDLLLLENQIPLFVLEELFKIGGTAPTPVQRPEIPSLGELLVNFLTTRTVESCGEEKESSNEEVESNNDLIVSGGAKDFDHLLHLYYHWYVTKPQTAPTGCTNCGTILKCWLNLSRIFTLLLSYVRSKTCRSNKERLPSTIPSEGTSNHNQNQNQNHQSEPTGGTNCGTILKCWLNLSRIFTLLLSYVRSKTCRSNKKGFPKRSQKKIVLIRSIMNRLPRTKTCRSNKKGIPKRSQKKLVLIRSIMNRLLITKTCRSNKKRLPSTIPSATELLEAGVTIKKKKNQNQNQNQNRPSSFLDVTFCPRHGVLEIPFLSVDNSTLPLFSNLVAFEQCGGCEEKEAYMTSYAAFMDCLVNTPEDEAILRQRGILENNLASDEHLAVFFNQLSEWIVVDFSDHYLAGLFQEVGEYCDSAWHKWRAKLVRDYFNNPWAIISLIAAVVVLILTFLQTVYSILSYDK